MSLFLSSLAMQLRRLPMARQIGLSGSKAAGSSSRFLTTSASLPVSFLVTPMPYYSFPTEESWKQLLRRNTDSGVSSVESFRGALRAAGVTIHDAKDRINSFILERKASEGSSTVAKITMANIAVYIMWKLAPAAFMVRHFANSLESMRRARVWTAFTSNFSHMGIFHLTANMYILNRFGQDVAEVLGSERFCMFYGTAGVASSLASLTFRRLTKSNVLSLGASGAVVSTLWLYACFFPDRRMRILGTEKTLTMQELVLAYTVFDAAGLLGSLGKIDFAAHLGGAIFGNFWFYLVRDKLVQEESKRESKRRTMRRPQFFSGSQNRKSEKD